MVVNRLLVKGGKVVNFDFAEKADVYIEDGVILQVGENLSVPGGATVVDATDKLVIPGGIDPHTHLELSYNNAVTADDFYSGTRAAVAGGTTMVLDYVIPNKGERLNDAYERWRKKAEKSCIDYSFNVTVRSASDSTKDEMEQLVREKGVNAFKLLLSYKNDFQLNDSELLDLFAKCRELGCLAMVHCENGDLVEQLEQKMLKMGITGPEGHFYSHVTDSQGASVEKAVLLSSQQNCPVYIVHVITKSGVEAIARQKRNGQPVFGETLAVGLGADGSNYFNKDWAHAARYVFNPPLENDSEAPKYLMNNLASGILDCVGTDHAPFTTEQRSLGKNDFTKIATGASGIEDRMSLVWTKGVVGGLIDECQFVDMTSAKAARIFNLYPKKGRIAVGSDADIVVWDPTNKRVLSKENQFQGGGYNLFEGQTVFGSPVHVLSRGVVVMEDGHLRVSQGKGKFVARKPHCAFLYNAVKKLETLNQPLKVERDLNATSAPSVSAPVKTVVQPVAPQEDPKPVVAPSPARVVPAASEEDRPIKPAAAAVSSVGSPGLDSAAEPADTPKKGPPPGQTDLHKSGFRLDGGQADDDRPIRPSSRVIREPGGGSSFSFG